MTTVLLVALATVLLPAGANGLEPEPNAVFVEQPLLRTEAAPDTSWPPRQHPRVGFYLRQQPLVAPGARVRLISLFLSKTPVVGTILQIRADTLIVDLEEGRGSTKLPFSAVSKLEISLGRSRLARGLYGGAIGLLPGAGVGYLIGRNQWGNSNVEHFFNALGGAIIGGSAGIVIGSVIGAATAGEKWQQVVVPPKDLGLQVVPSKRGGLSVIVSRNF